MSDYESFLQNCFDGSRDDLLPDTQNLRLIDCLTAVMLSDIEDYCENLPLGETVEPNFRLEPLDFSANSAVPSHDVLARLHSEINADPKKSAARSAEAKAAIRKNGEPAHAINTFAKEIPNKVPFIAYRGGLYTYAEPVWRLVIGDAFTLLVRSTLSDDTVESLSKNDFAILYTLLLTDPRLQINDEDLRRTPSQIVCRNGVYNIFSREVTPLRRNDYHFTFVDVAVDNIGDSGGELFEQFVGNLSGGDDSIRQLLLELIGVVISGYNPKKFFVLLGAKNSGKSQFLILLSLFVGVICTMSVNDVNDFGSNKFLAGELVGKKLCICADLPRNILSDKALAILKQLTGGDMLQGERKYRDPFFFHNEASLVIGANHAISHSHYDDAFDSRMITVPFLRSVPQSEQIPNISARLIEEAGYIIFHACEALRELVGRNFEFTVVDADYWTNDTIIGGDLIADFIEAECVLDTEANTSTRELFERFGEFCGGTSSMPVTIFARKLSQVYGFETWRTNEKRGFRGIRLVTGAVPNHSKTE